MNTFYSYHQGNQRKVRLRKGMSPPENTTKRMLRLCQIAGEIA